MQPAINRKRAFTLIELSLVLVVIAGLMAVILMGARKMTAQARTTETIFAIQKFSNQLRDYLSQYNEGNAIFTAGNVNDITAKIIPPANPTNDVVPSELKINGLVIYSPYGLVKQAGALGTYSEIKALTFANNTNDHGIGGPYYGLYVTNLEYNRCVDLITALASTDSLVSQYGVIRVQVNSRLSDLVDAANDVNIAGGGYVPLNKMVVTGGSYSCQNKNPDGTAALNNVLFAFRLR